jgi:hypothetical protein
MLLEIEGNYSRLCHCLLIYSCFESNLLTFPSFTLSLLPTIYFRFVSLFHLLPDPRQSTPDQKDGCKQG